jgi:hypothetical protein
VGTGGAAGDGGAVSKGVTEGAGDTGGEGGIAFLGGRMGTRAGPFSLKRNCWPAKTPPAMMRTITRMIRRRFCRTFELDEAPISSGSSARFNFFMRPPGKRKLAKERWKPESKVRYNMAFSHYVNTFFGGILL